MSAPISPQLLSHQNTSIIAGDGGGKRIRCTSEYQPRFDSLKQAAGRNHYWALLAIKELNALTTGMLGKNNVYVRPGEREVATGNSKYYVFLPGLKATVVRWANDQFCITKLDLDPSYYKVLSQGEEGTRMGIYRVSKEKLGSTWGIDYAADNKILPRRGRMVSIADASYSTAFDAAQETMPRTVKLMGVGESRVTQSGTDIHFTPGRSKLGGLLRYNPLSVSRARGSAFLLADAMEAAQDVDGVIWSADHGGSVVLTQAMQILIERRGSLKKYTVYFHRPRTSPASALELAHKLDMRLNQRFADTGLSMRGALSQFSIAGKRINNENDPYDKNYHAEAWLNGGLKVAAPAGFLAAMIGGQAGLVVGGIATAIGGAGVVHALGKSAKESFGHYFKR
ncbi:hypothetical protein [Microbulbifer agarilyticus]